MTINDQDDDLSVGINSLNIFSVTFNDRDTEDIDNE